MFGIRFNSNLSFFDSEEILEATQKKQRGVLSKAGAFVRRTAKGLIRPGKKPSKPGRPPHTHGDHELPQNIFFAYDNAREMVVVGPEKLNQVYFNGDGQPISGAIPEVLEEGGTIQILEVYLEHAQKWVRADLRSKRKLAGRKTRLRKVKIEARPYMGPALKREIDKLPGLWADVITD
jgi:hypothetical protein